MIKVILNYENKEQRFLGETLDEVIASAHNYALENNIKIYTLEEVKQKDYSTLQKEHAISNLYEVMKTLDDDKEVFPELTTQYEETIKKVSELYLNTQRAKQGDLK